MNDIRSSSATQATLPLLIAGDSHTVALGVPLKSSDGSHQIINIPNPGGQVFGAVGTWPRNPDEYWTLVCNHCADKAVALMIGGNTHLSWFLLLPNQMFDFVVSDMPDLPLDETLDVVPEATIRAYFRPVYARARPMIRTLPATASRVLIAGTPPPKEDDFFLLKQINQEPYFLREAERLGMSAEQIKFSPPLLRLKLWLTLQGVIRDFANELGAVYVPVPAIAQTEAGFLKEEYYENDVTHANNAFGKLMIAALLKAAALP